MTERIQLFLASHITTVTFISSSPETACNILRYCQLPEFPKILPENSGEATGKRILALLPESCLLSLRWV